MSKQKKRALPSLEIIIILVFFFSFILWAVTKCGSTKEELATTESEDGTNSEANTDSIYFSMPEPLPPKEEAGVTTSTTTGTSDNRPVRTEVKARLYVTIDGLNMRTGPHLDSAVVEKFPLFEEVIFMDEYTDFTQELSLGKETANEPWVKVKSKRGKVGWVWGAGIDYRRKKREGLE